MKKLFYAIEYVFYTLIISRILFLPGIYIRQWYLKLMMKKNIKSNVTINQNVVFGSYKLVEIGKNVNVSPNTQFGYAIGGRIKIKNNVLIGHEVLFINNMHEYRNTKTRVQDQGYILPHKDIVIENSAWIGARVTIMPGVKVGKHSVVATGAVVTKSIPAFSIAAGVPAKIIKKIKHT